MMRFAPFRKIDFSDRRIAPKEALSGNAGDSVKVSAKGIAAKAETSAGRQMLIAVGKDSDLRDGSDETSWHEMKRDRGTAPIRLKGGNNSD
jgi:hypothetical protein